MGLLLLIAAFFLLPSAAMACGYGTEGGADYVPQRQAPFAANQTASAITAAQARQIVLRQVSSLNPNLKVGNVNDAGRYYEVQVINSKHEIVQVLGVDKATAFLTVLN